MLPAPAARPAWRLLLDQMVHFFALLLWVASGLAFVAQMPTLGVAIALVVLINGLFAFVQEHRTERAAQRLRDLLPRRAMVLRDGQHQEIDAADLVRGDAVLLGPGAQVSADLRIVEAHGLVVDTSTLTGESVPAPLDEGGAVYAGTFVVEGEGVAVVEQTGTRTRLASLAQLTRAERRPPTPRRLARTIAAIALSLGGLFLLAALVLGIPTRDAFLFAVGLTVALVPEALLPTVTLSLALGAQRMAKRNALVRRLEAVETLGSTTLIFSDKTGTLTRNEMAVVEVWTSDGVIAVESHGYDPGHPLRLDEASRNAAREIARVAGRTSTGRAIRRDGRWVAEGDPMEAAIDVLGRRLDVDLAADRRAAPDQRRFAFDPRRRMASVIAGGRVFVKGAPDAIFARCAPPEGARRALDDMTRRGLRVLGIATRPLARDEAPRTAEEAESKLTLLGLLGFEDPPRPHAAASVAACRAAGIRVGMITGDHPATAVAIAREVGLLTAEGRVLEGRELPGDADALARLVTTDGMVFARISPEDKLRIAEAARRAGHVVAMTGDGVNDGPALHAADIGVAMGGTGTDVAREAADLVLLDDDFATIVGAIEQGRATYQNARGFLTYHLTDNVAEVTPLVVWALSGGQFPLALGVLQILALDIGTDTLSAVALGAEPSEEEALTGGPQRGRLLDRQVAWRAFGVLGPVEAVLGMAAFLVSLMAAGWRPGAAWPTGGALLAASGATFATVVLAQTANAFACRSPRRTPAELGWVGNRLLVVAVSVELALGAVFLLWSPLATLLDQAAPPLAGWLVALAAGPVVLLVDASQKRLSRPTKERVGAR